MGKTSSNMAKWGGRSRDENESVCDALLCPGRLRDVLFSVRRIRIQRNSAFTLIEVLVVIAIIALLLAILIPSLATAKEKSRRVVCQSNLHQFSIGLNGYANSNRQMLPSGRSDMPGDEHTPVLATRTRKELLKYVDQRVLECPWLGGPFKNTGGWYYPGYGYVLGYNYLGGHRETPWTAPEGYELWKSPQTISDRTTVPILTELNAWTTGEQRTWAPHGTRGPITQYGDQGKGGMTSVEAGAAGGNSCLMDGSVSWKHISSMKYYQGSQIHMNGCRTMW
jgi:prepilin-type N-terminal cleavage/methylation domain-containing protein